MDKRWSDVDRYFEMLLVNPDPLLKTVLKKCQDAGLPQIQVSAGQGKLLELLVRMQSAARVLEIGTLGGYSTAWLAKGLSADGQLISLEIDPDYAALARRNLANFPFADMVDIRVGDAVASLETLYQIDQGPFDLFFFDADKAQYCAYLRWAIKLSRPGAVIVADNVVRDGEVINPASSDPKVLGVRAFNEMIAADPRLEATAIQTVGEKGYDGFALIVVKEIE